MSANTAAQLERTIMSYQQKCKDLSDRLADAQARAERAEGERDRQRSHVKAACVAGMAIECRHRSDVYDKPWEPCNEPQWLVEFEYRIALTPAPQGRTDGERLEWLEKNARPITAYDGSEDGLTVWEDARGGSIRAAIDAAMDATAPKVKGGAA